MQENNAYKVLSPNELDIMNIFWDTDKPITTSFINDNFEKWTNNKRLFRLINSLLANNFLIPVDKVYVTKKMATVYEPAVSRLEYETYCFDHFFNSSPETLAFNLIKTHSNNDRNEVISRIQAMLDQAEEEL